MPIFFNTVFSYSAKYQDQIHYSLLNTVFFNHNLDSLVYQYNYALMEFKDNNVSSWLAQV